MVTRFSSAKSKRWSPPASPKTRSQKQYCTLILQTKQQLLARSEKDAASFASTSRLWTRVLVLRPEGKITRTSDKGKQRETNAPSDSLRERTPASSAWTERLWRQQSQQSSAINGKKLRDVSRLTKCGLLASNTPTTNESTYRSSGSGAFSKSFPSFWGLP